MLAAIGRFIIIYGICSLIISTAYADTTYGNVEVAKVVSIYDADTFDVNIANWPTVAGQNMPVRVAGIDSPEMHGQCKKEITAAHKARDFTVKALQGAKK